MWWCIRVRAYVHVYGCMCLENINLIDISILINHSIMLIKCQESDLKYHKISE